MYSVNDLLNNSADDLDDVQSIRSEDEDRNNVEENQNDIAGTNVDEEVKKDENDDDKTTKKPRKKSNRPVLNVARLNGPRGLICMENMFSTIKFKGKGCEREDLNTVMKTLQHWSHRLYPKFAFDDTIEQLEKLGTKKPVITMKKKILMNMIDEEVNIQLNDDDEATELLQHVQPSITQDDPFDLLVDKPKHPTTEMEITDEMQEIMERNRQLAAERRRAKLEAMKQNNLESNQITTTIQVHHSLDSEIQNHSTSQQSENTQNQRIEEINKNKDIEHTEMNILEEQNQNTIQNFASSLDEINCINDIEQQNVINNENDQTSLNLINTSLTETIIKDNVSDIKTQKHNIESNSEEMNIDSMLDFINEKDNTIDSNPISK